ncbi:hypothetical protein DFH08DRAFT_1042572 [Mycena albidolilacea]|uniref:Reverse transcriptase zinc-binding domain-containing protein n=1 Tax=Mycena albidolilacea TaxID=1033008 RepID=A0AAD7EY97_9AGAR|nr:hypothetical protein DFH08DRAFT_1042572 [Mycena albidolilacea]
MDFWCATTNRVRQHMKFKVIYLGTMRSRKRRSHNTMINLERIHCSIAEEFLFQPSDKAIWTSIRSTNIHRLTRNFLWKCPFWEHIPSLETFGLCETCRVTESMEHILLECDNPGQHQIWTLTKKLWRLRFPSWPKLNWGLILGCGLARFKSPFTRVKNCFFTILVSTAIKLIWNLRNERLFETYSQHSSTEIHNRWVSLINTALKRDILLTDRIRFGSLAIKKELVLHTWSGTLLDEESLPDDWVKSKGVLVGIRPTTLKDRVG